MVRVYHEGVEDGKVPSDMATGKHGQDHRCRSRELKGWGDGEAREG